MTNAARSTMTRERRPIPDVPPGIPIHRTGSRVDGIAEPILDVRWANGTLHVRGEVDHSNAELLVAEASNVIAHGGVTVLALGGLRFLDVSGAHAIVHLADRVRPHGCHLLLRDLTPQVRREIRILDPSRRGVGVP